MADTEIVDDGELVLSPDRGVLKKILQEGTGEEFPSTGCKVAVHYTGTLLDGTKFDSSVERNQPFEFVLGKKSVIQAFDLGVASMKLAEKCILTCAPKYAYGASGSPPNIPPNATLKFELEMLGWKGEDLSPQKDGSIERFTITKSSKKSIPEDGLQVNVHIVGKYEGRIFDDREVSFNVGEASEADVIAGIDIAMEVFHAGETSRLVIQPKHAFGDEGHEGFGIPPKATVEYTVTLHDFVKVTNKWDLEDEDKIKNAQMFKEKGTNYLKQEKYKLSAKMFEKALSFITDIESDESRLLQIAINLNKALGFQKTNEHLESKKSCDSVLSLDANNIKALYRRGQANLAIGYLDSALADFSKIHEIEPENKAAINQVIICKQQIKEFNGNQKKVYANMFTKFAAVDKKKEETDRNLEPDVLTSCGEWTIDEERSARINEENIIMLNGLNGLN